MSLLISSAGDFDISAAYAFDDENFAAGIWFSRFAAEKREEESK